MFSRKIISLLLLLFSYQLISCQDMKRIDSLLNVLPKQKDTIQLNTYIELFAEYIYVDNQIAKPYLEEGLKKSMALNNQDFVARFKNMYGVYYWSTSQYEKGLEAYNESYAIYKALGNKERQSAVLNNKGNILRNMGKYHQSLETHMQSLKLKEDLNVDDESLAASYWNIGNLQGDIKNYKESNAYYNKSKAIYEKLNLKTDLITIQSLLAINLKSMGENLKSIPLLEECIAFYDSIGYHNDLAGAYDNLGQVYLSLDSLDLAKENFEKSLSISKNYGEITLEALNIRNLGEVYLKEEKYSQALENFKKAHAISLETGTRKRMIRDYEGLAEAYAGLGNYKAAYEHHLQAYNLYKDILGQENMERMNELEVQYQTEKKEKELMAKENEIKLLEERKKKNDTERLLLIIGLFSVICIALLIFYALKQKMKRNQSERDILDQELEFKKKELTTHALHLAKKNEVLENIKQKAKDLKSNQGNHANIRDLIQTINFDLNNDNNWENFKNYFEQVHKGFNSHVKEKYPEVSTNDLRLMALLKMNMSTKEIANILNISVEGVKKARYRLRKKLDLTTDDSLHEQIIKL